MLAIVGTGSDTEFTMDSQDLLTFSRALEKLRVNRVIRTALTPAFILREPTF